jgi:tRNA-splicing ligase RtcB (3'-phosphate/5'-hydroxy nucleic acid ligase)
MGAWLQPRGMTLVGAPISMKVRWPTAGYRDAGRARPLDKVQHTQRPLAVAMAGGNDFDPFKD